MPAYNKIINMCTGRKNIRLSKEIYSQPGLIFSITVCTENKKMIFQDSSIAQILYNSLKGDLLSTESEIYAFCIMPDHVHLLIGVIHTNLIDLIGRWKSYTTREIKKKEIIGTVWQRSFYDHALRKDENIEQVAKYIIQNPVRAGLVNDPEEYLFSWHTWMN